MFETWLRQEKETIKERFGKSRILCIFLALLMVPLALLNLIMLLDGGGAMQLGAFFFMIVVPCTLPTRKRNQSGRDGFRALRSYIRHMRTLNCFCRRKH